MGNGFATFSAIKRLLYKYNINFQTDKEYDQFMRELIGILKI